MRVLKDILLKEHLVGKKEPPRVFDEKTVFYIVRKIIQEEYGLRGVENIIPILFKEGVMYLSSRSSLWANEIWIEREHLREKTNLLLGKEIILEVKMGRDTTQ